MWSSSTMSLATSCSGARRDSLPSNLCLPLVAAPALRNNGSPSAHIASSTKSAYPSIMTPNIPLGRAALAVLASIALTHVASAQTTATWIGGNTTNDYNVSTNWDTGSAPNAVDSQAIFTAAASTSWTNATNTLGSIIKSGSGNLVIGSPSAVTNVLVLDNSTGKPIISNSSTLFMYAELQGTNSFTKLGSGELSFRFNARNLTYAGDIELLGGTLTVNQASSLGNVNNRLLVGSNSVFSVNNGANTGTFAFESTRTFVVSNGITFSIRTGTNAIAAVFSNSIVESGTPGSRVDFQNVNAVGNSDTNLNVYTLAGTSNNWSARTTIQLGAKVILAPGSVISTNELNMSSGSGTWAVLDLGGNTQNVQNLSPGGSSTTARFFIISNGTLNVTAPTAALNYSGANGTTLDMSNLVGFNFIGASNNRNFLVRPDMSSSNSTNFAFLAAAGAGSNTITANDIIVGTASGTTGFVDHMGVLAMGKTNNFFANQLLIGGFNGAGTVQYLSGITNGSLVLRGSNGVSAMNNITAGSTSSGVRRGTGVLDVGTVDALANGVFVGIFGANTVSNLTSTSQITMAGGTLVATNLTLGGITNTSITGSSITNIATFQQNGGTVTISNIRMGDDKSIAGNTLAYQSTYNLSSSNAVLRAAAIDAGTNANFGANSFRKLNFGAGRIETYDASTDLTISGFDTTSSGRLEIAVASNAQTKTFFADTGRKITLESSAVLTFDGGITKDGAGTLVLKGANVHKGNTTVSAGTLEVQPTGSLAFDIGGNGTNNKINGVGTAVIDGKFAFNLAGASTNNGDSWNIVSNSVSTTYGTNFLVTGFSGSGGLWTNTTNGVDYVFAQSNSTLVVQTGGPVSPYNAWVGYWQGVDPGFTNTAGTANPDGDAYVNNEEFAFDGNPTVGTGALLIATKTGTNAVFTYAALTNTNAATYQVQNTTNLATGPWTNSAVTISNSTNQSGLNIPASYVRREFTVPAASNSFYRVQAFVAP